MLNSKSGIVTVEAAIFLAVVTIALVAGFNLLASEIYTPGVPAQDAIADDPATTDIDESQPAVAAVPAGGVLGEFIEDMKANLF